MRGRRHEVTHLDPLRASGPSDAAAVGRFLSRCNQALESLIRRNPEQWVWFHRRWSRDAVQQAIAGSEPTTLVEEGGRQ
jgi:lauroyl/myristoyl acyltransferase